MPNMVFGVRPDRSLEGIALDVDDLGPAIGMTP